MQEQKTQANNPQYFDLREVLHRPDASCSTEFELDMSQLEFYGDCPIQTPVKVQAIVTNHAGALTLEGTASSTLTLRCDRCNSVYKAEKSVTIDSLLAQELQNEEHEEIILLEGYCLNLEEVATTAYILAMDSKQLCSEQCKGICPDCGVNLNEENCACQAVSDSPFSVLAQLLDN